MHKGKQLLYNYPWIYEYHIPQSFTSDYPEFEQVAKGKHIDKPPWNHTVKLASLGLQTKTTFFSFAKFTKFDAGIFLFLPTTYA